MAPVRRGETQALRPPWSMIEEVKKTKKAGEVRSTTLLMLISSGISITAKYVSFLSV